MINSDNDRIDDDNDPGSGFDDARLEEMFSRLRLEEEQRTPSFLAASPPAVRPGASFTPVSARRPFGRIVAGVCACVAILAAVLWLRHEQASGGPGRTAGTPVASITEWKPATDFLLKTPGSEMLQTVPVLEVQAWPASAPRRSTHFPKEKRP